VEHPNADEYKNDVKRRFLNLSAQYLKNGDERRDTS